MTDYTEEYTGGSERTFDRSLRIVLNSYATGLPPAPDASAAEVWATWSSFVADLAQISAILIGGIWAYRKFVLAREEWPRATLEHEISHFELPDKRRLVRVVETVSNPGTVLLEITERRTELQQLVPPDERSLQVLEAGEQQEATWLDLGRHEAKDPAQAALIEPGESDPFVHDFVIDPEVAVLQVYSYFKNAKREENELGWTKTTTYDLGSPSGKRDITANLSSRGG